MGDPTLKVVVAWSERRNLCSLVRDGLLEFVAEEEVLALGDEATVVCTEETAAAIRDRLRDRLGEDGQVFVAEFEVWSGQGGGVDGTWLRRRGH